jgi:hypothetical protein
MEPNISFGGGGYLYPFYLGVAKYIQEHFDCTDMKFGGVSAGSVVATCMSMDIPVEGIFEKITHLHSKNPFNIDYMLKNTIGLLNKYPIPKPKRLSICLTQGDSILDEPIPVYIDTFKSRTHLYNTLRASCHVPYFSGLSGYKVDGKKYFDGNVSRRFVNMGENSIYVSIFNVSNPKCIGSSVKFPFKWCFVSPSERVLKLVYTLGYLEAQQYFSSTEPSPVKKKIIKQLIHEGCRPLKRDFIPFVIDVQFDGNIWKTPFRLMNLQFFKHR